MKRIKEVLLVSYWAFIFALAAVGDYLNDTAPSDRREGEFSHE